MIKTLTSLFQTDVLASTSVIVVSFPRSGHHALVGFLSRVSDFSSIIASFTLVSGTMVSLLVCSNTCLGAEEKWLWRREWLYKNHASIWTCRTRRVRYIVQYRHPFHSIQSWYEMEVSKGKNLGDWPSFRIQVRVLERFMQKWVVTHGAKANVLPTLRNPQ